MNLATTFHPFRTANRRRQPDQLPATCNAPTSGHDGIDPRRTVVGLWPRQTEATICRGCRAVLIAAGTAIDDRRSA